MKFSQRRALLSLILNLAIFGVCWVWAQNLVVKEPIIHGQVQWSGNVLIQGDVTISRDARLTIEPGTVIKFATKDIHHSGSDPTRCELIVKGALFAKGQIDKKITFTSAAKNPKMHDWYGIKIMNFNQPALFNYVIVEYAYNGFDIKKSNPVIRNSQIRYNYNTGVRIAVRSKAKLIGNIIQDNGYAGVVCETGAEPILADNMITKNQFGIIIFGTAKPNLGDLSLNDRDQGRNGLFDNYDYDVYNHGSNPIKAEGNSWGTEEKQLIMEHIFDGHDSPQYGVVDFNPIIGNIDLDRKMLIAQQTADTSTSTVAASQIRSAKAQKPAPIERKAPVPEVPLEQEDTMALTTPLELRTEESEKPIPQSLAQKQSQETVQEEPTSSQIDFNQIFLDVFLDHKVKVLKKKVPVISNPELGMNDHGNVIVRAIVNKEGKVEKVEILRSLNYYYDRLALEAAKEFIFQPGTVKGVKVKFSTTLLFRF